MDASDQTKIEMAEIDKLIGNRFNQKMLSIYRRLMPIIENTYEGFPEVQILKHEICLCLLLQLNQAAITLSNHLIESFLKYALIYHDANCSQDNENLPNKLKETFKEPNKKYGSMKMYDTIEAAFKMNLIDDAYRTQLHKIRNDFRNAYSHAEQNKIHKDSSIPLVGGKFVEGELILEKAVNSFVRDIPVIQSICQSYHAEATSLPYFEFIMVLIDKTRPKIFPSTK